MDFFDFALAPCLDFLVVVNGVFEVDLGGTGGRVVCLGRALVRPADSGGWVVLLGLRDSAVLVGGVLVRSTDPENLGGWLAGALVRPESPGGWVLGLDGSVTLLSGALVHSEGLGGSVVGLGGASVRSEGLGGLVVCLGGASVHPVGPGGWAVIGG